MTTNFWQRHGLTPAKALLIGMLSVVFVAVIAYQFRNQFGTSPRTDSDINAAVRPASDFQPERRGRGATATALSTELATEIRTRAADWPSISLGETLAHNPFATPKSLVPPPPALEVNETTTKADESGVNDQVAVDEDTRKLQQARAQAIRELMTHGASIVMTGTDGQRVAVVNGRSIHVGDTIHGMRVTDITSDGVVLEAHSVDQ